MKCKHCGSAALLSDYELRERLCARCRICVDGGCTRRALPESRFCVIHAAAFRAHKSDASRIARVKRKASKRKPRRKHKSVHRPTRTLPDTYKPALPKPKLKRIPANPKPPPAPFKPSAKCEACKTATSTTTQQVNRNGTPYHMPLCQQCCIQYRAYWNLTS